jgi:4,5-DOPA dioxygenase extradiol
MLTPSVPELLPIAFIGHGSPMNAIERNRYTEAWRTLGGLTVKPRAILVVSAHWYVGTTAVTTARQPRTIHDFQGFPAELARYDYPAPGMPELAIEVADLISPDIVLEGDASWGLDHGTWSVLTHAFPKADVPVVQLSINANQPAQYHLDLGRKLHALRRSGVLVVGSGNTVHNLGAVDFHAPNGAYPWARAFNEKVIESVCRAPGNAAGLVRHADFWKAAPTPEHFLPLLYIAGMAAEARQSLEVLVDGYTYGSLAMTSFVSSAAGTLPPQGKTLPGSASLGETRG